MVAAFAHGIDPRRDLNTNIGKAAAAVGELIEYFDLSDVERADLQATAAPLEIRQHEGSGTGWHLYGLWMHGGRGDGQEDVGRMNAVRLVALTAFSSGRRRPSFGFNGAST
ncbi:hypothetical protein R5W24_006237 [Gemmata sp. JC717]|uniref:hypothetical protein n=1 Tax=Gemmata algarum TaxID=2975278 RepID=UPI0021BB50EF|nr:hypothetical protein [Gemmata algarum]MDY3557053.1 hypothetical protein [Gemmata algarum]